MWTQVNRVNRWEPTCQPLLSSWLSCSVCLSNIKGAAASSEPKWNTTMIVSSGHLTLCKILEVLVASYPISKCQTVHQCSIAQIPRHLYSLFLRWKCVPRRPKKSLFVILAKLPTVFFTWASGLSICCTAFFSDVFRWDDFCLEFSVFSKLYTATVANTRRLLSWTQCLNLVF